jgi:hypothetical protein
VSISGRTCLAWAIGAALCGPTALNPSKDFKLCRRHAEEMVDEKGKRGYDAVHCA